MKTKLDIAKSWLHRYTGTKIDEFGDYMLLTNFADYVEKFAKKFNTEIKKNLQKNLIQKSKAPGDLCRQLQTQMVFQ